MSPSVLRSRSTSAASTGSPAQRRTKASASARGSSASTYWTARSMSVSLMEGALIPSLHQVPERLPHGDEPAPAPALHGAQRSAQVGGDLRLREPLEVRHLERPPLALGQLGQRLPHPRGAFRG